MKIKTVASLFFVLLITISCNIISRGNSLDVYNFPLSLTLTLDIEDIQRVAFSDTWIVVQTPGKLTSLDLNTKEVLWSLQQISSDTDSEFVIVNDNFVSASRDEALIIDKTGKRTSVTLNPSRQQLIRLVAFHNNYIYLIRGGEWTLEVYDISKNSMLWETWVGRGQINTHYNDANNVVYITTPRALLAFDNSNGKLLWEQSIKIQHSTYENDILYILERDNGGARKFTAINVGMQKTLWRIDIALGDNVEVYNMTIVDNLVIISTRKGLKALDKNSGMQIWSSLPDDIFYTKPVLFGDTLYARGSSQTVYALSIIDGKVIGYIDFGQKTFLSGYEDVTGIYKLQDGIAINTEKRILIYKSR